ncbi:hypothetical protein [Paraburkholderia sp.]|uniref:hypothetical protein n=1 Tax=Paraburkholderia sp. TaxID=1926495 RepID=UPI002B492EA6|nr:hypothetical protein [Paraburkholderia sp.]
MTRTFSEPDAPEDINQLYALLFDSWCERRSVIPLAYLMDARPILGAAPLARRHLLGTLEELRQFHPDSLSEEDHQVIGQLFALHVLSQITAPEGLVP